MPRETARRAIASDWFDRFARFGYAAKGVVFGVVGMLAARVAMGSAGEQPDVAGAMGEISEQPLRLVQLGLLAAGLVSYSLWRITQGTADLQGEGRGFRGWSKRLAYVSVGLVYGGFAIYAVGVMAGWSTEDGELRDVTAMVLGWPGGQWLVGAVGLGVLIAGLVEIFFAVSRRFEIEIGPDSIGRFQYGLLVGTGALGHAAQGAVYIAAGYLFFRAALRYDPEDAAGLAETFRKLATQPFGPYLVWAAALGFLCFGIYCLMLAFHRHIPKPRDSG